MSSAPDVDLLSEQFFANSFPTFERLRTEAPVYFFKPLQCFIRLELEETTRALLALPRWELGDKPYNYAGSNFQDRGPSSLHVRFPGLASPARA